jgi:hypothetical protein
MSALVCKSCDIADLRMMQTLQLENCDGHLDKAEYIILCMLRLRAIDAELVAAINEQFDALDSDENGLLEYAELLQVNTCNMQTYLLPARAIHTYNQIFLLFVEQINTTETHTGTLTYTHTHTHTHIYIYIYSSNKTS